MICINVTPCTSISSSEIVLLIDCSLPTTSSLSRMYSRLQIVFYSSLDRSLTSTETTPCSDDGTGKQEEPYDIHFHWHEALKWKPKIPMATLTRPPAATLAIEEEPKRFWSFALLLLLWEKSNRHGDWSWAEAELQERERKTFLFIHATIQKNSNSKLRPWPSGTRGN